MYRFTFDYALVESVGQYYPLAVFRDLEKECITCVVRFIYGIESIENEVDSPASDASIKAKSVSKFQKIKSHYLHKTDSLKLDKGIISFLLRCDLGFLALSYNYNIAHNSSCFYGHGKERVSCVT